MADEVRGKRYKVAKVDETLTFEILNYYGDYWVFIFWKGYLILSFEYSPLIFFFNHFEH